MDLQVVTGEWVAWLEPQFKLRRVSNGEQNWVISGVCTLYSRFGGLRGSPMVPDGWYGPPGHRGGRL